MQIKEPVQGGVAGVVIATCRVVASVIPQKVNDTRGIAT